MSQEAAPGPLWALVPDLFLRVKIEAMSRAAGRSLVAFPTPAALLDALATAGGARHALVLVDLGAPGDAAFVLLAGLATREDAPPSLAFFSHVDDAAKRRAVAAGATRVVPRSALVARFDDLVAGVSGTARPPG